jgi:phosphoribosylanthranilate isomerase
LLPGGEVKVKVCGVTTVDDARLVAGVGADYVGVVVGIDFSPRCLSIEEALPICQQSALPVVALFFDWEVEALRRAVAALRPHAVQLLGQEPPELVRDLAQTAPCKLWKTVHLPPPGGGHVDTADLERRLGSLIDAGVSVVLIDTVVGSAGKGRRYGGTGQVNDWAMARRLAERISVPTFLAGGIKPENVERAIGQVRPHGIDLCSGVESSLGRKDPEKLRRLMTAVRQAAPETRC